MSKFSYGEGLVVSISRSEDTLQEILRSGRNSLLISDDYCFKPFDYYFEPDESARVILDMLNEFDVVEFYKDNAFKILYSETSNDNAIVVTNKCNSNCIMCPCSEAYRKKPTVETVEHLRTIIKHMPTDARYLTITGGEPTIINEELFVLLGEMKRHFLQTRFLFLSNARAFSDENYTDAFIQNMPENLRFAVPLYGYSPETHDAITQTPGSFMQALKGIAGLLRRSCEVEIRIVVSKLNHEYMTEIANLVISEYRKVICVNIIATEMCGAAAKNRASVWIDYQDAFKSSTAAIKRLLLNGIDVELYNFPLCKVDPGYWSLCARSISDYKINFYDSCKTCEVKQICGGVFKSTLLLTNMELKPIIGSVYA